MSKCNSGDPEKHPSLTESNVALQQEQLDIEEAVPYDVEILSASQLKNNSIREWIDDTFNSTR